MIGAWAPTCYFGLILLTLFERLVVLVKYPKQLLYNSYVPVHVINVKKLRKYL